MNGDQDKDLIRELEETEKILSKEAIKRLEITFLILVTIGLLILTRVWD